VSTPPRAELQTSSFTKEHVEILKRKTRLDEILAEATRRPLRDVQASLDPLVADPLIDIKNRPRAISESETTISREISVSVESP
jgi:hypothetical protein